MNKIQTFFSTKGGYLEVVRLPLCLLFHVISVCLFSSVCKYILAPASARMTYLFRAKWRLFR